MTKIYHEIIPYAFYLIALLIYLASLKKKNIPISKNKFDFNGIKNNDDEIRSFLNDSEKKLKALKDLYVQELIEYDLYIEKTNQIAGVVSKILKKNIFEYGQIKNDEIIEDLKKIYLLNLINKNWIKK
tara:strand:- start:96 stop:479 length:384 start_codon:yes stop_codon:yes gene_type:complete